MKSGPAPILPGLIRLSPNHDCDVVPVRRPCYLDESMIKLKYEEDREFKIMLMEEEKRLGFIPDVGSLARMMAYVLMNKIIFYKVLEEKYTRLPPLLALDTSSKNTFLKQLDSYFEIAVTETGDFEPIFKTGIYDMLDLPDMLDALEYINEFIETKIEGGVLLD